MAAGDNRIRIEVQGDSGDLQAALKRSRDAIRGVGDESDRQTTRAGRHFDRLRERLRRPISARVEAETRTARERLAEVGKQIKDLERARATMKVDADVAVAEAKLRRLRSEMRKVADEHVRVGADTAGIDRTRRSLGGLDGVIGKVNQRVALLRNGFRLMRWPLIATGAGIVTQALSAAAAGRGCSAR